MSTTLAEKWEARAAEAALVPKVPPAVQARRDYYAGARDAVLQILEGRDPKEVMSECFAYARTIGTKAEAA